MDLISSGGGNFRSMGVAGIGLLQVAGLRWWFDLPLDSEFLVFFRRRLFGEGKFAGMCVSGLLLQDRVKKEQRLNIPPACAE